MAICWRCGKPTPENTSHQGKALVGQDPGVSLFVFPVSGLGFGFDTGGTKHYRKIQYCPECYAADMTQSWVILGVLVALIVGAVLYFRSLG